MRSRTYEIRHALRSFIRTPGFTLITVLTLATGIAANAAIFSVVDGVLLESLPYPESGRLVFVSHTAPGVGLPRIGSSTGLHLIYSENARLFEDMTVYRPTAANLTGDGDPDRVRAVRATRSFFSTLRVEPRLGRYFSAEEDLPDGPRVAVVSHGLWSSRFGSDPAIVGRTIEIDGITHEIIGVMGEDFAYPDTETRVWIPMRIDPSSSGFGGFNVEAIGRLTAAGSPERAQSELRSLFPRAADSFADLNMELIENAQLGVEVRPLKEVMVGPVRTALWIVMGTVGFVLLIACANVANLFLARAEGRQKEVAIRTALGAGRSHLFWQYSGESAILALASGLLGTALAYGGLRVLLANAPGNLPRIERVEMDGSVLLFTAAISLGAAFLFGALPMVRSALSSPGAVLRDGSRGATAGRRRNRGRHVLVATQVAFAVILLIGSGLMLRSFERLLDIDLGFQPENVLTFRLSLPAQTYEDLDARLRFHRAALDRLAVIPGVESVGAVTALPLSPGMSTDPLNQEDKPLGPNEIPPVVPLKAASAGYFETMGIPLLAGRMLERADADDPTGAVLINRTLAEQFWPGEDPIGRRISHGLPGNNGWSTIVGVVGDTHLNSLTEEPMGLTYYALRPLDEAGVGWIGSSMAYVVRGRVPADGLTSQIRSALREIDPNLPIASVRTLEAHVADARVQMAFTMLLLSVAAVTGLILGAVGIYGVISYLTSKRTREIGVRMALGAEARTVRSMVLRQGATVAAVGLVIGLLGAVGLTRFLDALLYEVSATDPVTFGAVSALLLMVSLIATYVPARRAAATSPQDALRAE
jgi:putative ABC transport system permease protein